ncbi:MAG: DNA-formamidopyrimidine glycosylase [Erysipelotrichaceae bacterium]
MPELPEVETVLRTLETRIKDQPIKEIDILWDNIIVGDKQLFKNQLRNQHFRHFKRRGKYMIFEMDDVAFVSHLRMEGKYYIEPFNQENSKHIHVVFHLEDFDLKYHDTRKFGKMEIIPLQNDYHIFKNLGPEPFDNRYNISYVAPILKKSNKSIKEILLDQSFVAGIGNIYADEILFLTGVRPSKKANKLTLKQMSQLIENTKIVLNEAIEMGGTTIRSYTSSLKVTGLFQQKLYVHTRVNQPCVRCENTILKTRVGGRGTYYCAKCQK